jgi:hypothetical protein
MSGVSFNVRAYGMPQYKKKILKLGKDLEELDKPMRDAGKIAKAALRSYPPYDGSWREGKESFTLYRPGSKYKRKGDRGGLKTGWEGKLTKGSKIVVRYSLKNNDIKYAKFVQGLEQSSFHAPWWLTVEKWEPLIREETTKIFREFMKDIVKKSR